MSMREFNVILTVERNGTNLICRELYEKLSKMTFAVPILVIAVLFAIKSNVLAY